MPDTTTKTEEPIPDFDSIFLGHADAPGGGHLETPRDINEARREEFDQELLLSQEAEKFCHLIVLNGYLPSDAYLQAFTREDSFGVLIKPDSPVYQARLLLRIPEVKMRIEELRAQVLEWGKTSFEELEANLRRIALDPAGKDSDRIAASKALSAMRGFDAVQPGLLAGATISITMPFAVKNLAQRPVTIDGESEVVL